jgi:MinD-like ATPase involved in chromosome partitioning or flagellar assembly
MSWHDEQAGEGWQAWQPAQPGGTASDSSPLAAEEHTRALNVSSLLTAPAKAAGSECFGAAPGGPAAAGASGGNAVAGASGVAAGVGDGWECWAAELGIDPVVTLGTRTARGEHAGRDEPHAADESGAVTGPGERDRWVSRSEVDAAETDHSSVEPVGGAGPSSRAAADENAGTSGHGEAPDEPEGPEPRPPMTGWPSAGAGRGPARAAYPASVAPPVSPAPATQSPAEFPRSAGSAPAGAEGSWSWSPASPRAAVQAPGQTGSAVVGYRPAPLRPEEMLPPAPKPMPVSGWRRAVCVATAHKCNLGDNAKVRALRADQERIGLHFSGGARTVAVNSPKGGVAKTTVAALLAKVFGLYCGGKVACADANPDRGTLIKRILASAPCTVRDVAAAAAAGSVRTVAEMANLVAHDSSRADFVGSDADPEKIRSFTAGEYRAMVELFNKFYDYNFIDCGTDLTHEVTRAALSSADGLVLVTGAGAEEASVLDELRDMLFAQFRPLLAATTLVIQHRSRANVDTAPLEDRFLQAGAATVHLPYDRHLADGGPIEWNRLSGETQAAVTRLGARVVDGVAGLR